SITDRCDMLEAANVQRSRWSSDCPLPMPPTLPEPMESDPDNSRTHDQPEEHQEEARTRRRGIYLLPNLLTTGAVFAGIYAILAGMNGNFHLAAMAIFVAMFFAGLDGQVARMTNTQSAFGVQYDSLSDMVS